jgi:hypothetical protein
MHSLLDTTISLSRRVEQQSLHVAFDGCQIAIHSDIPEAWKQMKRCFREMLEPAGSQIVVRLGVYGEENNYRLTEQDEVIKKNESLHSILRSLKYEAVLRLIKARPEFLWLHAGAARHRGGAVLIVGPSGRGKSTLVTSLCARGWSFISDDIVPLDPNSSRVTPFPQTPEVRQQSKEEYPLERIGKISKTLIKLKPEIVCRESVPVRTIFFPKYSPHSQTKLIVCSPVNSALELLQSCINFVHHRERAVRYIRDLVQIVPAFHLHYSNKEVAAELVAEGN